MTNADRSRMMDAQRGLYKMCDRKATAMIALEIGGGNGLQGMILGASSNMDLPTVGGSNVRQDYITSTDTGNRWRLDGKSISNEMANHTRCVQRASMRVLSHCYSGWKWQLTVYAGRSVRFSCRAHYQGCSLSNGYVFTSSHCP